MPRLDELTRHAAALGLKLSVKLYPDGTAVRDAPQLRLVSRLRSEIGAAYRSRTEVPVAGSGDLRAWDMVLDGPATIAVDAETRLRDIQALQRRTELKLRDSKLEVAILLVSATHHNRAVLREYRAALMSTFPLDTREILACLRSGLPIRASGIVVL